MQIISLKFVIATLIAGVIFYLLNPKYRGYFLALLSCVFIFTLNYLLLPYILLYSVINFSLGRKLENTTRKLLYYRFGIGFNLLQLILLRYASFTVDPLFDFFGSNIEVSGISKVLVPLGISYFTLQGIGYLINVKMGWEKPERNFADFLVYITFFPKFLSGPIERSNHFLPQLKEGQDFDSEMVSSGLRTALIGFFKKVAIANQLAPFVFDTFSGISSIEGYSIWVIFLLLPIYLYFDFSGYTDIAIGFARVFGINLLPNFNRPFFAENVSTFWRRFHISLASWFNDYVFRQTVLNRRRWGVYASVYAVFITWVLFGIWHGGGWHFMLLGFLQALAINYEFFTRKIRIRLFSKLPKSINAWMGRIFTYLFYCVSLVFFFSKDLSSVFTYFSKMFTKNGPIAIDNLSTLPYLVAVYIPVFLFLELIQNDFPVRYQRIERFWQGARIWNRIFRWSLYSLMITIIYVVGLKSEQFVYANF